MLKKIFENVFNSNDHQKIDSLENIIATTEEEAEASVKIKGKDVVVPAEKVLHVQCKTDVGFLERKTPMMFQQLEAELPKGISAVDSLVTIKKGINNYFQVPAVNLSKHDIVLHKNTNVGVIEYVKSIIPLQVEQSTSCKSPSVNKVTPPDQILEEPSVRLPNKTNSEHQQRVVNTIDLSGLTTSEKEKLRAMLREESEVFATDGTDIGNVDHNKMKIRLKDDIPCQTTYNSPPRPLYQ